MVHKSNVLQRKKNNLMSYIDAAYLGLPSMYKFLRLLLLNMSICQIDLP